MKLIWFGHAAFRLEIDDKIIMIDPFLSGNPAFDGNAIEVSKGATHVALTHGHGDHFGDTLEIIKATGAQLVADFDICMFAEPKGAKEYSPMNTGGSVMLGDLKITMTHANHSSALLMDRVSHSMGCGHGLIFSHPNMPTIYHMGDTDIFSDMALINELYQPQVGLVPIGDRFTMGGEVAALACKRYFNFSHVVPCHYGSFPIIDQTADKFVKAMQGSAAKIVLAQVGQEVRLD